MDKTSIYTIAQYVGVSGSTVSRALAGKDNVNPETRQRILAAAEKLNYSPNRLARRLSGSEITIVIFCSSVLLKEFNLDIFRGAYDAAKSLSDFHVRVRLCYMPNLKYTATARDADQIISILESGVQGAINIPSFSDEQLNERISKVIRREHIAQASILIRPSGRKSVFNYLSDTYSAGALAAELLWNMLGDGGKVSIFTGQHEISLHADSIRGFQDAMKQYPLELVSIYENHDDPEQAYHAAEALLRDHPDVRGLYVGSANSLSVCRHLAQTDRAGDMCLITSDMYADLLPYLDSRMVRATVVQDQYTQTYETVRALADYLMTGIAPDPAEKIIRPGIVMSGNARRYVADESDASTAECLAAIEYYDAE